MLTKIIQSILRPYGQSPFLIQQKAKLFLGFLLISAVTMVLLAVLTKAIFNFLFSTLIALSLAVMSVVCIFILKSGRYHFSSIMSSGILSFAILILTVNGIYMAKLDFLSNYYYVPMVILYTALFCELYWLIITTAVFMASGYIFLHLSLQLYKEAPAEALLHEYFTDYCVSVFLTFVLCFILVRFYNKMNQKALDEAKTAKDKNILIKKISDELIQERDSLEERVRARTVDLNCACEKLKELDRFKSDFFANVSHEIRTPLTLILPPLEAVLQGRYHGAPDKNFFITLHKYAVRLHGYIDDLLDFSKIDAGRMILNIREIDIFAFIENYIETVSPTADSLGITVAFTREKGQLKIYADTEKLDKIVMNLLSNAFKYTERGEKIMIGINEDEYCCRVVMEDTGRGIPADKLSSIFERFIRADDAHSGSAGTGIGLALVKEFVDMHGWRVSVASRHIGENPGNHGTRFEIIIPKETAHLKNRKDVVFASSFPEDLRQRPDIFPGFGGLIDFRDDGALSQKTAGWDTSMDDGRDGISTILVVDDNPDMRELLRSLLAGEYRVITAVNGEDGVAKTRSLMPDLIIADIMMPVMNGLEMTGIIKKDESLMNIPILMLTARAGLDERIHGFEHGADEYLAKPFNPRELIARVKSLIRVYDFQKIISSRNSEIEEELDIARQIQAKLLPESHGDDPGFSVHAICIPMDKVGGDFYDIISDDDRLFFYVADVSGHGIPGAFYALITKVMMVTLCRELHTVEKILSALCKYISDYFIRGNFVTCFIGTIDKKSGTLHYSSAGHIPPCLHRPGNQAIIDLTARGIPIGWDKNTEFEKKEIKLEPGDRIIVCTDGIIECLNEKKTVFGDKRYKDFILDNRGLSPSEFSERLIERTREFTGSGNLQDDMTLIVIDVN